VHSAARGLIASLPAPLRFVLLLLPRLLIRRCGATRVAAYAVILTENGNHRMAKWCWDRAIRLANDESTCNRILRLCVGIGQHDITAKLAKQYYDENGVMLAEAVRLTGMLVLSNGFGAALEIYDRLLERSGDDLIACWPAPAWPQPPGGRALRSSLAEIQHSAEAAAETSLYLNLARLCFSFEAFDMSAGLFERVAARTELDLEDRIAHAYSLLRNGGEEQLPRISHIVAALSAGVPAHPDWQVLLATVQFACGKAEAASSIVEQAMRARFAGNSEVEHVVSNCRQIVACIARCPGHLTFTALPAKRSYTEKTGLRKIFICGNGWSGSGALYDALTEYEGFAEAPDTPLDHYVNQCTGNEMMLVQGEGGLGHTWRKAREGLMLSRLDLWELFRCHVLGGGAVGFTEHKGAKTALDFLMRMGSRYTEIFRQFFESVAALPMSASLEQLRRVFTTTTEAFSSAIADRPGDKWIVFNNAVFGSNVDMLDIFSNFRAAVVVRDPLDQFVDRRKQDLKHWMTANRFVPVYRASRLAFLSRWKELQPNHASEIREVEFERFVLDQEYRQSVLDWLLEGLTVRRSRHRFDPERSAQNIGIHASLATRRECSVMGSALVQWRRS